MDDSHAEAVLEIYQAGIDEGNATFETTAPTWEYFSKGKLEAQRFVALDGGSVVGWVVCSPVSTRDVYRGVVELSIYVSPDHRGKRIGRTLLDTFIDSTETAGIWTIKAGIFPENTASLALHKSAGFREIGYEERIGFHPRTGTWRDVIRLERRSAKL